MQENTGVENKGADVRGEPWKTQAGVLWKAKKIILMQAWGITICSVRSALVISHRPKANDAEVSKHNTVTMPHYFW